MSVLATEPAVSADDLLSEAKIGAKDGAGKTCVVAMSGGVDSAVTALVMRERGYRVVGINLRLFSAENVEHRGNPCCGIPAMEDARRTCAQMGVSFYAINMETEFNAAVIDRFVNDYAEGRTPNPCLECNRHVKFRHLVQRARLLGADCLATGHYARIVLGDPDRGRPHRLFRARDQTKDQSYVLYALDQAQLGFVRFPLGNLRKSEVRQLARTFDLPVADKPESQEICFVGGGTYAEFVASRRPDVSRPGDVVDADGQIMGRHRGLVGHTVGQRRGLGIAAKNPLYVLRLEPITNRVVVGSREDAAAHSLKVDAIAMIADASLGTTFEADGVVRYRGTAARCTVAFDAATGREATITFAQPGPISSPGQAVVFYRDDEVLGGGTITQVTTVGSLA